MKSRLVLAALATLGIIDTAYLTYEHFSNFVPPCPVHPTLMIDCGAVLRSQYSTIYGVPLALLGLLYYLFLLTLVFISLQSKRKFYERILLLTSVAGLATSCFLLYLQLIVIKSICLYCTASGGLNLLMFGVVIYGYLHYSRVLDTK